MGTTCSRRETDLHGCHDYTLASSLLGIILISENPPAGLFQPEGRLPQGHLGHTAVPAGSRELAGTGDRSEAQPSMHPLPPSFSWPWKITCLFYCLPAPKEKEDTQIKNERKKQKSHSVLNARHSDRVFYHPRGGRPPRGTKRKPPASQSPCCRPPLASVCPGCFLIDRVPVPSGELWTLQPPTMAS